MACISLDLLSQNLKRGIEKYIVSSPTELKLLYYMLIYINAISTKKICVRKHGVDLLCVMFLYFNTFH